MLIAAALGLDVKAWEAAAFAAAFAAASLIVWITTITPGWVHEGGEAYATRLLESAIRLPPVDRV
jgi:hypothetical protein